MKNLKIRTKLLILVAFMLLGAISIGVLSLLFMKSINDSTTKIADGSLPSIILAEEINTALSDVRTQEYKYLISRNTQEKDQVNAKINTLAANFENMYTKYTGSFVDSDTERNMIQKIKTDWDSYLSVKGEMIQLSDEGKNEEAMSIMTGDHLKAFDELTSKCLGLVEFNKVASDDVNKFAAAAYASALRAMIAVLVAFTLIIIVAASYIVRGITKPIGEIDHVAQKISDGQLNETLPTNQRMNSAYWQSTLTRLSPACGNTSITSTKSARSWTRLQPETWFLS